MIRTLLARGSRALRTERDPARERAPIAPVPDDADRPWVHNAWYAAARSHELGEAPVRRKLLGTNVVLYREHGAARALGAVCPHRGADLSRGKVVDGALQCPFHGWRFDGRGACVHVPSQPPSEPLPSRARVPCYPLREQQGILWIWMGAETPDHLPPDYDFWEPARGRRRYVHGPHRWAAPFLHVMEQSIDSAHHPFVHRASMGRKQSPRIAPKRIRVDDDGRGLRYEDDDSSTSAAPRGGLRGRLRKRLLGLSEPRSRYYRFDLGGTLHLRVTYEDGHWEVALLLATPADLQTTWVFAESIRTRAVHPLGEIQQRRFFRQLVDEDEAAMRLLVEGGPHAPAGSVSVRADEASLAFRKLYMNWLNRERGER